jgi:uncharacterized protein YuzE
MPSSLFTYDPDVNALYLQCSEAEITEALERSDDVSIDVDADGQPVGLEVLNAARLFADRPPTARWRPARSRQAGCGVETGAVGDQVSVREGSGLRGGRCRGGRRRR